MTLRLAAFLSLLFLAGAPAADWYVDANGNDSAPGTLVKPFGTIQRAQSSAEAGDTIHIRGGTYKLADTQIARSRGIFASIIYLDKSGAPGKPITYRAYESERPVFDCSEVKPANQRVSAFHVTGSWIHLIGLEVIGVQVTMRGHTQSICFESQGSNNMFERLSMHDGQAIGIYHVRGSNNLFLNCDAYNNWDYTSEDGKGGNTDGFGCHPTTGSKNNIFRGCRAWFNSDDGYDCLGANESVIFENCWAMYNGFSPKWERTGDGNGFKAGGYGTRPADRLPKVIPRHTVRFCIAVGNKNSGFYANHHPGGGDWINNSAYRNGMNYNMLGRTSDNTTDIDGTGHRLLNNLSYGTKRHLVKIATEGNDLTNNSFTLDLKLTGQSFQSLNEAELFQPRQPNGDLPSLTFLRPTPKSPLLKAGAPTGLPNTPAEPDIGALQQ